MCILIGKVLKYILYGIGLYMFLTFKKNTISNFLLYTHYTQGSKLLQNKKFENMELSLFFIINSKLFIYKKIIQNLRQIYHVLLVRT